MKIGIDFDNTLTDTNYTLINLMNEERLLNDRITYDSFEELNISSVWSHPKIKAYDYLNRSNYDKDLFYRMELGFFAAKSIKKLQRMGDTVTILTGRPLSDRHRVEDFLQRGGIDTSKIEFIFGVNKRDIQQTIIDAELDMYIDDSPEVIARCTSSLPLIVVRGQTYNQTCFNMMRLECFSQLPLIRKRAVVRIDNIHNNLDKTEDDVYYESENFEYSKELDESLEALSIELDKMI